MSLRRALVGLALLLWWFWPQLAPALRRPCSADHPVLAVLAEDPRRTSLALDLWQRRPGSTIWIIGHSPHQQAALRLLGHRGMRPRSDRYHMLLQGDDTVGQLTALSRLLPASVCRLVLITDSAHRDRALAIARQALGPRGIAVASPPGSVLPQATQPEAIWRLWRDLLRVQLWRATGWDGRSLGLWLRGGAA